ncbi:GNAT family acetyltransferase [Pseudomonas sp. Fl5BN2]|uniref:GNAT family acetyltransferase n=1 Tax=Pseudomonas sp. Fl5BN2 TaxID=2697652 RepID=UPI001378A0AD|nr:GNAT family acetyltransferase [Pseudomonas sp. Fl5BN2]NBF06845.1 GNAT family acetyltransferase [Pseudomonas sp. Fl5BN2]
MNPIIEYSNTLHRQPVIDLWNRVFGYDTAHNTPSLAIDKKIEENDGLFFVALADEQLIGTLMAGYDGHRGWLYSLAVDPQQRRRGTGRALVRHGELALGERGCLKINLQIVSSNASVQGFYQALGYQVEPRISMGKVLTANIPEHLRN